MFTGRLQLEPLTFVDSSRMSLRYRTSDGFKSVMVVIERRAVTDYFGLPKSDDEECLKIIEANLDAIAAMATARRRRGRYTTGSRLGIDYIRIVIGRCDFAKAKLQMPDIGHRARPSLAVIPPARRSSPSPAEGLA